MSNVPLAGISARGHFGFVMKIGEPQPVQNLRSTKPPASGVWSLYVFSVSVELVMLNCCSVCKYLVMVIVHASPQEEGK